MSFSYTILSTMCALLCSCFAGFVCRDRTYFVWGAHICELTCTTKVISAAHCRSGLHVICSVLPYSRSPQARGAEDCRQPHLAAVDRRDRTHAGALRRDLPGASTSFLCWHAGGGLWLALGSSRLTEERCDVRFASSGLAEEQRVSTRLVLGFGSPSQE